VDYKYFLFDEFDCPTQLGSGYRTPMYNTNHFMASTTSTHLIGRAAHIECVNAKKRLKIVESLSMVGFKRFGLGSKYIHVDNDDLKPNMIWFLR